MMLKKVKKIIVRFVIIPFLLFLQQKREYGTVILEGTVASVTTTPSRLPQVRHAVTAMLKQTLLPEKIILWLDEKALSPSDLPESLKKLISERFEVRFCEDVGPATKLIPSLKAFPDKHIITFDDDILYPKRMVEELHKSWLTAKEKIHAHRVHRVRLDSVGNPIPYLEWEGESRKTGASRLNFLTGVGGVFYPAAIFNSEVFNTENLLTLSPKADDVWFFCMMIHSGKECVNTPFFYKTVSLPSLQSSGLFLQNIDNNRNDMQLKAVLEHYGLTGKLSVVEI